jgi:hypothetical protein
VILWCVCCEGVVKSNKEILWMAAMNDGAEPPSTLLLLVFLALHIIFSVNYKHFFCRD